jgi:predicted acyltransferase
MTSADRSPSRIVSLDQFRGYTVAGMFLVNFVGSYAACPRILKHTHDYCSYADTIMPQFLFAVGFAFRLTFERRVQKEGAGAAYRRMVRRLLGLALLSAVVYAPGAVARSWTELQQMSVGEILGTTLKRSWFQTLMHIAVTSLWILPVIRASAGMRVLFALASAAAHVALSAWFNFEWVNTGPNGIDGGPLGFLTWTIPAIAGTLACDALIKPAGEVRVAPLVGSAVVLMALGWGISCGTRLYDVTNSDPIASAELNKLASDPVIPRPDRWEGRELSTLIAEPPFVPPPPSSRRQWNYWMMSQRAGTLSYLTFAAGFSLLVCAAYYVACDRWGWRLGLFETLGTNALAGYIIHGMTDAAVSPFVPRDSPAWYMWAGFAVYFAITWLFLRTLEKNRIFLRL